MFCTKCGASLAGRRNFCGKCGMPYKPEVKSTYRRANWFELIGAAILMFFFGMGLSGCGLIFWPILIFSLPLTLFGPPVALLIFWRAIVGPCPYCGQK